jgi:hypothetical protein
LPFYLAAVWYLTVHYGIVGTAVAWLLRVTADCILLFLLADRVIGSRQRTLLPVCLAIGAGAVMVAVAPLLRGLPIRLLVASCVLAFFGLIVRLLAIDMNPLHLHVKRARLSRAGSENSINPITTRLLAQDKEVWP